MATRLLLDGSFPPPPSDPASLLPTGVTALALGAFDPDLADGATPDWYTYLRAAEDGLDALVARAWHQVDQPEELLCLVRSSLSVVTWRRPPDDPLVAWDQLVAHLPQVTRLLARSGPSVVLLPASTRGPVTLHRASDLLDELARALGRSIHDVRGTGRRNVATELAARGERGRFTSYLG